MPISDTTCPQIAFNGAIGVLHHVPFPVIARASWGFWGSYVAIISRAILAIFWFSIQTMNGANNVRVMIGAIWPSFLTLPNHIPESQGIDTATMISFFIFWLCQLPFVCMHPNQLRFLFMAKSIIVPAAWLAVMIWAFASTKGHDIFQQRATVSGSAYSFNDLHHRQLRDSLGQPSRFFALLTRVSQMAVHVRSHATALLHIYRLHRHRLGFGWKLPLGSGRMGSHGSGLALGQSRR